MKKAKLPPYLSSNKNKIVKTTDGVPLKRGLYVYCVDVRNMLISKYKVWSWHNGINALSKSGWYSDVSGSGGCKFFTKKQVDIGYNCFCGMLVRHCYADLEKAKSFLTRKANEQIKSLRKIAEGKIEIIVDTSEHEG